MFGPPRSRIRIAARTALLTALLFLPHHTSFAQADPVVMVRPTTLDLSAGAMPVEIWVDGAPELAEFDLTLSFDADLVAVTAVEAGAFLSSTGGTAVLKPRFPDTGTLALSGVVALTDAATAPSGSGVLATVTLAPLAKGGPSTLGLRDVVLQDASGASTEVDQTVDGATTVSEDPQDSVREAAVAQATQMAESAEGSVSLVPELPRLPHLPDMTSFGGEIVWLGLLLLAVAVVVVGWMVGRRPPRGTGTGLPS